MERPSPVGAGGGAVVFRPGALGDTILTGDALAAIRARWPERPLELVGNASAGALLATAGLVDRVTSFDSPEVTTLYAHSGAVPDRWRSADLAVLWLPAPEPVRSALRAAGARTAIWAHPAPPPGIHAADHLLATLLPLGVTADPVRWSIPARGPTSPSGEVGGQRRAVVHPGSGAPAKNWPPERFAALIGHLRHAGFSVLVLRGPADGEAVRRLQQLLVVEMPEVAHPADLDELIALLTRAALFVGNDSGVSHVSARLGVPTVAVFGPTDPQQWAPRGPRALAIAGSPWPTERAVWTAIAQLLGLDTNGFPS